MGIIFWAANFQIFLGIPDIPDFFLFIFFFGGGRVGVGVGLGVNSRCWVQAYVGRKIESTPWVSLGTDLYFYSSLVWGAQH